MFLIMGSILHSMKATALRTGLSPHSIRMWERRYRAVTPKRNGTNRRLYDEEDISRLTLLRKLTEAGHSIGNVAGLPAPELERLANVAHFYRPEPSGPAPGEKDLVETCLAAVKDLDERRLQDALREGEVALGSQGLLQRVIGPLAQRVGDLWRDGTITAAHEHLASEEVRSFLAHTMRPFAFNDATPLLLVATPAGQLHELGALLAAASAANLGWRVTYLGVSLPAAEIAGAARQQKARAVALSLVYPEDDPHLEGELTRLRELMPPEISVLVGGRAAAAYQAALEKINAHVMSDLSAMAAALDSLRKTPKR